MEFDKIQENADYGFYRNINPLLQNNYLSPGNKRPRQRADVLSGLFMRTVNIINYESLHEF